MSHPALRGLQLLVITVVSSLATAITAFAATRLAPIKQAIGETTPMFDAYLEASAPCNQYQLDIELNISKNNKAPIETFATETAKQGSTIGLDTPVATVILHGDALRGVLKRTQHTRTVYLPGNLFSAASKYHEDSGINAMKCPEEGNDNLRQTAFDITFGPSTSQTTGILCPSRGIDSIPIDHRTSAKFSE